MSPAERTFKYIWKRWYIVLICAVIGAGLLYVEKSQVAPSVEVNGDLLYTRVLCVDPLPVYTIGNTSYEVDLLPMIASKRSVNTLIVDLGAAMDFEKLSRGWGNLKQNDKTAWVARHFHVSHIGPGLYELEVEFASTDAKDTAYLEAHSGELMDVFMQVIDKTTAMQRGAGHVVKVEDFNLSDTKEIVTQQGLQKKYIIVGFVLGGLVGTAVLSLLSLRRKEEG